MTYKIPLFDLNFDEAEEKAVLETLRSKWISTGPKNTEFEKRFSSMLGVKYSLALSNCTVALHLALRVLEIKDGDEVICPSLTFVATVNAVKYVNATPVFCDIRSYEDPTMDTDMIKSLISNKTKAILVMHYGGFPCNMNEVMALARKYNLKVIEDAAHAPMSEYNSKKLGTIGDIGCFSFFSNKNISTGEGGMIVTNNENYYNEAKLLRSHGMTSLSYDRAQGHVTEYDVVNLGYNYRLDDIHAAIGIAQLEKLRDDLQLRTKIRSHYVDLLTGFDKIIIPFKDNKNFVSNYIFPIVLKGSNSNFRDHLRENLKKSGIQTSVHYPAVHRFSIYRPNYKPLPKTEYVCNCELSLPMYSKLIPENIEYIVQQLEHSLKKI